MGLFNKIIVLLMVVLFVASWEAPCAISDTNNKEGEGFILPTTKTHVIVYNFLDESLNFTIHCKSKDDDLGPHVIGPYGHYSWEFKVNVWGTTLFFCSVSWRDGCGVYDLYKARRDEGRCNECEWHVTKDSLDGYNDFHWSDIYYNWDKPPCVIKM